MKIFLEAVKNFSEILHQAKLNARDKYVFYKIIDNQQQKYEFVLQCANTKNIFYASIVDMVNNKSLLSGLLSEQACYIGIQYSNYIKDNSESESKLNSNWNDHLACRYGKYKIISLSRNNKISFIDNHTGEKYQMDPRDIALTQSLINEFDAMQAFYIGFLAGLKLKNPINSTTSFDSEQQKKYQHLRLVK